MLTPLAITPDLLTTPWPEPELGEGQTADTVPHGILTHIGLLPGGTGTGRASVALRITTPDGKTLLGETTLHLFAAATRTLLASPIAAAEGHDPRSLR